VRTLEDAFTRLLGRQPSEQEKRDLYRTRDALNLRNDDALWLLLMALGHYETLYRKLPALISEAATTTMARLKEAAQAELRASAAATKLEVTAALVRTAATVGPETIKVRFLRSALSVLVISALCFSGVGWFAHRQGLAAGFSRGWAHAHGDCSDERAAASWANTPDGRLAHALARAGSIRDLANCSGQGWVRKGTVCFPRPKNGSVQGWRLPSAPDDGGGYR
jgi:hypothetical protein